VQLAYRSTAILFVALIVLSGGCIWGDQEDEPSCNCPNTERIATEIDWTGDGKAGDKLRSAGVGGQGDLPFVKLDFNEDDLESATTALDSLFDRLSAAGPHSPGSR
jgi:hypothetical protein